MRPARTVGSLALLISSAAAAAPNWINVGPPKAVHYLRGQDIVFVANRSPQCGGGSDVYIIDAPGVSGPVTTEYRMHIQSMLLAAMANGYDVLIAGDDCENTDLGQAFEVDLLMIQKK